MEEGLNGIAIDEFRRQYQVLWDDREHIIAVINELCPALVGETHEQTLRRTIRELREEREKYGSLYPEVERLKIEKATALTEARKYRENFTALLIDCERMLAWIGTFANGVDTARGVIGLAPLNRK